MQGAPWVSMTLLAGQGRVPKAQPSRVFDPTSLSVSTRAKNKSWLVNVPRESRRSSCCMCQNSDELGTWDSTSHEPGSPGYVYRSTAGLSGNNFAGLQEHLEGSEGDRQFTDLTLRPDQLRPFLDCRNCSGFPNMAGGVLGR